MYDRDDDRAHKHTHDNPNLAPEDDDGGLTYAEGCAIVSVLSRLPHAEALRLTGSIAQANSYQSGIGKILAMLSASGYYLESFAAR